MAAQDSSLSPTAQPITPEAFLKDKVAPQFHRRINDLRRQITNLEQQVQERMAAQATVRVVIEGDGGGIWYLNVKGGEMTLTPEPAFPPMLTIYQPRAYFDWAVTMAGDAGLFGPSTRAAQGDLTKSRIDRLKMLKGLIRFTFTHLPDGSEQSFSLQLGEGERPTAPQLTLSIKVEDAQKLARGEINAQAAFMGGIIKITGDMALAMQFGAAMM
ncbi:MAG: SCP2 sterol-binding domain-containing protein [Candidatus Binatia bacterium]